MIEEGAYASRRASHYRWVVLFASFSAFVVWAFVFQLVSPLLNEFQTEFRIGETESGLLISMAVIPGILFALPAGFIINKYGFRLIGFLSIVSVAIGGLTTAVANNFAVVLLGRFILGCGGAFLIVGAPTIIPQWFSRDELGKAMGVYGTNMPIATILAFPLATMLNQSFGWRSAFYVGALVSLVVAAVFVATTREGPLRNRSDLTGTSKLRSTIKNAEVWKASLIWLLFETLAIGFLSWAPTVFQQYKGFGSLEASLAASVFMYLAAVFVPLWGWSSDRFRMRRPFIFTGLLLMALTLVWIAFAQGLLLLLLVVVFGVSASMAPPLVMSVVGENLPPEKSGVGFGVITLCQNVGIAISAPLTGYLLHETRSLPLTFLGLALFGFVGAIIALTIRNKPPWRESLKNS